MTLRLPFQKRCYATTMTNTEEVKEQFYSYLRDIINCVLANDIITLIGNFVARIGSVFEK